jgi:hypothetical protein
VRPPLPDPRGQQVAGQQDQVGGERREAR